MKPFLIAKVVNVSMYGDTDFRHSDFIPVLTMYWQGNAVHEFPVWCFLVHAPLVLLGLYSRALRIQETRQRRKKYFLHGSNALLHVCCRQ